MKKLITATTVVLAALSVTPALAAQTSSQIMLNTSTMDVITGYALSNGRPTAGFGWEAVSDDGRSRLEFAITKTAAKGGPGDRIATRGEYRIGRAWAVGAKLQHIRDVGGWNRNLSEAVLSVGYIPTDGLTLYVDHHIIRDEKNRTVGGALVSISMPNAFTYDDNVIIKTGFALGQEVYQHPGQQENFAAGLLSAEYQFPQNRFALRSEMSVPVAGSNAGDVASYASLIYKF